MAVGNIWPICGVYVHTDVSDRHRAARTRYGFKSESVAAMRSMTIGKLAREVGVNLETIRYYERIGLMSLPPRTSNGHRCYAAEHVRRLTFIRRARELGFGLEDIRDLLALAEPGKPCCGDVRAIAAAHLHNIRSKLADLAKLEAILGKTVARCSGEPKSTCAVLDVLDPDRVPARQPGLAAARRRYLPRDDAQNSPTH